MLNFSWKHFTIKLLPCTFFFIGLAFSLSSCYKEISLSIPVTINFNFPKYSPHTCYDLKPSDTTRWKTIWQSNNVSDTSDYYVKGPLLFENGVVFSSLNKKTFSVSLVMFEKMTGKIIWTWEDYFPNDNYKSIEVLLKSDDKIIFHDYHNVYCINSKSGKSVWRKNFEVNNGFDEFGSKGKFIFVTSSNINAKKSYISRIDINSAIVDTIFTESQLGKFKPISVFQPDFYTNLKGETILIAREDFLDTTYNYWNDKVYLVAYNMGTNKVEFRMDSLINSDGYSVVRVIKDKVYFMTSGESVCIDIPTRKIIWRKNIGTGNFYAPLIVNGTFFLNKYAINAETGNIIWTQPGEINNNEKNYQNGKIYYTGYENNGTTKLYILDAQTGKKLWEEVSPNKYPNKFNNSQCYESFNANYGQVAIDSIAGNIYTWDNYFTMCLKIPKL